jgi:hypothetical protein
MRSAERPLAGWYYKPDGQASGPVPTGRLQELLAAGRLQPRQTVWQQRSHGQRFVHAAAAAGGPAGNAPSTQVRGPVLA